MRIRTTSTFASILFLVVAGAACGGGDGDDDGADDAAPPPDAGVDHGFNNPPAVLKANMAGAEVGDADLTCLNTPSGDVATTVEVALATKVTDFQNRTPVKDSTVTVFPNQSADAPFNAAVTSAQNGDVTVKIPVGTKRFGFKMVDNTSLPTLLLNQTVDPNMATQTLTTIQSVSKATAQTLPALIGVIRTGGTGVLAAAVRDCQGREMSNFIATVSSAKGQPTHLAGADTYYFNASAGLPVKHNQLGAASADGLFMVIELQPQAEAFIQVWGFPTAADLSAKKLKLIAELPAPVIADTVVTGSLEPLRQ